VCIEISGLKKTGNVTGSLRSSVLYASGSYVGSTYSLLLLN